MDHRREEDKWIGVDLDGTLAHYDGYKGPSHIGEPIPVMLQRVKNWLAGGKNVKIFTARVAGKDYDHGVIRAWLAKHGLPYGMEITNRKDELMEELWDDRCVQVEKNTGIPVRSIKE